MLHPERIVLYNGAILLTSESGGGKMNVIQLMGHLGADPETRFTPSGQKVTNLRVATAVRKGGKEETVWYRVTIWGDRFDKMLSFLKKGSAIIVVGELGKPEIYTDKEGKAQVALEVTAEFIRFSPFGKGDKQGQEASNESLQGQFTQAAKNSSSSSSSRSYNAPDIDDGLPF